MIDDHQAGDDVRVHLTVVPVGDDGEVTADGTTTATVVAYLDEEAPRVLVAAPAGADRSRWSALLTDARPGVYRIVWTVTGTGSGVQSFDLPVGPAHGAGVGESYATTGDLAHYAQAAPPVDARLLLVRATARVDELLFAARYQVDELGIAVDDTVRAAIVEATCAQAEWLNESGDDTGSGYAARFTEVKIGNVQLGGGTAAGASGESTRFAPAAVRVLRAAGLLNSKVLTIR